VPAGGRFTLLYGIESGYGKVWVKDVKVFRISTSDHSLTQTPYASGTSEPLTGGVE
jgi:hypothetical protein